MRQGCQLGCLKKLELPHPEPQAIAKVLRAFIDPTDKQFQRRTIANSTFGFFATTLKDCQLGLACIFGFLNFCNYLGIKLTKINNYG
jgi:hypothetical protein